MGLEPIIIKSQILGLVAVWWRVLPTPYDRGWDSPGSLRPTVLRQLSPFYKEGGDGGGADIASASL